MTQQNIHSSFTVISKQCLYWCFIFDTKVYIVLYGFLTVFSKIFELSAVNVL